jgi:hypothetical protein
VTRVSTIAALRARDFGSFGRGAAAALTFDYAYVDGYVDESPQLGEREQIFEAAD